MIAVVLVCLLALGNTLVAIDAAGTVRRGYARVQDSQEVLTGLYRLHADLRALFSDYSPLHRDGQPAASDAFEAARRQALQQVGQIRMLLADRPVQQRRMDQLEELIRAAGGFGHPAPAVSLLPEPSAAPRRYDAMRDLVDDAEQDEWRLQAARIRSAQQGADHVFFLAMLRTGFSVMMLGLMFYLVKREVVVRRVLAEERSTLAGAAEALHQEAAVRQRAQEALRGRDMMFRGLADAIPQIVFVVYADGTQHCVNRQWNDYAGSAGAEAASTGWTDRIHPEAAAQVKQCWQQAMQHMTPFTAEFRLRGKDGEYRWFLARAVPVAEPVDSGTAQWVGTLTDIDDIRRADAVIRESEERFRRIFEGSPFGMILSEDGGRRIIQANPAFCAMPGYTSGELTGRQLRELSYPAAEPESSGPQAETADPAWRVREKRYLTKQGGVVWTRTRAAMFDPPGGRQHLLTVVEDITRQREVDEALRQAQRMEAVGQLSGGLAHDFNNLLGVIIGNIECLLDTMADDAERAELAREVLDSALGGAELTRRLLAFGRRQSLAPQQIDLSQEMARHISMLSRTLGGSIQVETGFADDVWPVLADPSQLGDALLNLAINARDAMPHGGVLTIETYNDIVRPDDQLRDADVAPGEYAVLAVSDTGVGMTPETRAKAVEPFFTTKKLGEGSGLGLSMIYGFARQSGGYLSIDSEVGIGTTVRISLPRAMQINDPARPKPQHAVLPTGHETILVVDDSPEMRQVAERHLRFLGYAVLSAANGPAAMALLDTGVAVDLLFTDIAMPEGLTGFQLADVACRLRPGLKVLFTTGYAGAQDPSGAPNWQDRLIRKPYRRPDLAEKVRAALV